MSWWPWDLETRLRNLEVGINHLWQRIEDLGTTGADMSKVHDRVRDLVADLSKSADAVIANAVNAETEWQDVVTQLEAVIQKLKQKIADDASEGSSTGGGSGARMGRG